MFLLVGIFIFYEIIRIPINTSIKGKNYSGGALETMRLLKILVLVFGLSSLLLNMKFLISFAINLSNSEKNREKYSNLYYIEGLRGHLVSNYLDMELSENMHNVYLQLEQKNNAVMFTTDIFSSIEKDSEPTLYHIVNDSFLYRENLVSETPIKTTVFLYESKSIDEDFLRQISKDFGDYDIVRYESRILNTQMSTLDYFTSFPYCDNDALLFVPEADLYAPYSIRGLQFNSEDSLKDVEEYIDNLMLENGLLPSVTVSSGENEYEVYYQYNFSNAILSLCMIVMYTSSIIMINKQIIDLDIVENRKRYYLEYMEGNKTNLFFLNFILTNVFIWSFSQCVLFFRERDIYFELLQCTIVIFVIEILIVYFYQKGLDLKMKDGSNI